MLSKEGAQKLAKCMAVMRNIKAKKHLFEDDKKLLKLYDSVENSLAKCVEELSETEFKMVMINLPREITKLEKHARKPKRK